MFETCARSKAVWSWSRQTRMAAWHFSILTMTFEDARLHLSAHHLALSRGESCN